MSAVTAIGRTIAYICVAVGVISVLLPQKRTRRIMSFVIGLFFISSLVGAFSAQAQLPDLSAEADEITNFPRHSDQEYIDGVVQLTAENLTHTLDGLLQNEGITAEDIRLTLKISDEGRIYASRIVIYISETDSHRVDEVESIIYRNLSKEPEIYVAGEKVR